MPALVLCRVQPRRLPPPTTTSTSTSSSTSSSTSTTSTTSTDVPTTTCTSTTDVPRLPSTSTSTSSSTSTVSHRPRSRRRLHRARIDDLDRPPPTSSTSTTEPTTTTTGPRRRPAPPARRSPRLRWLCSRSALGSCPEGRGVHGRRAYSVPCCVQPGRVADVHTTSSSSSTTSTSTSSEPRAPPRSLFVHVDRGPPRPPSTTSSTSTSTTSTSTLDSTSTSSSSSTSTHHLVQHEHRPDHLFALDAPSSTSTSTSTSQLLHDDEQLASATPSFQHQHLEHDHVHPLEQRQPALEQQHATSPPLPPTAVPTTTPAVRSRFPAVCDDGEPCTIDICVAGRSLRVIADMSGLASVTCACTRALVPQSCAGLLIPQRAAVLATKACSLFEPCTRSRTRPAAQSGCPAPAPGHLRIVGRAGNAGRVSRACAAELVARLTDARDRARRLAGVR